MWLTLLLLTFTSKNLLLEPDLRVPYSILCWLTRSSADLMGGSSRSMVKKAARFAVYEEISIRVKNHQALPTILPEYDLKGNDQNIT